MNAPVVKVCAAMWPTAVRVLLDRHERSTERRHVERPRCSGSSVSGNRVDANAVVVTRVAAPKTARHGPAASTAWPISGTTIGPSRKTAWTVVTTRSSDRRRTGRGRSRIAALLVLLVPSPHAARAARSTPNRGATIEASAPTVASARPTRQRACAAEPVGRGPEHELAGGHPEEVGGAHERHPARVGDRQPIRDPVKGGQRNVDPTAIATPRNARNAMVDRATGSSPWAPGRAPTAASGTSAGVEDKVPTGTAGETENGAAGRGRFLV